MVIEPANMDLLRSALESHPEAIVGTALDGVRLVLATKLFQLGGADNVRIGQALRWLGAERVAESVWLIPPAVRDGEPMPNVPAPAPAPASDSWAEFLA